jgi:hypothetical protein
MYDFVVSTANFVINPATILSSQKSTAWVNLLFTYYNHSICTGVHSNYQIQFVVWLSFNLSIHSCNKCGKSQKKTSCKSVNMYFSRYLVLLYGFCYLSVQTTAPLSLAICRSMLFKDSTVSTSPSSGSFFSPFHHSLQYSLDPPPADLTYL